MVEHHYLLALHFCAPKSHNQKYWLHKLLVLTCAIMFWSDMRPNQNLMLQYKFLISDQFWVRTNFILR